MTARIENSDVDSVMKEISANVNRFCVILPPNHRIPGNVASELQPLQTDGLSRRLLSSLPLSFLTLGAFAFNPFLLCFLPFGLFASLPFRLPLLGLLPFSPLLGRCLLLRLLTAVRITAGPAA